MPSPRFHRLSPAKRDRLLAAAAAEFAAHGFDGASLNRIIGEAGMSKGAVYYYIEDKADLFQAVIDGLWAEVRPAEALDPGSLTAESFWSTLEHEMMAMVGRAEAIPGLVNIGELFYSSLRGGPSAPAAADFFAELRAALLAIVRRGQELGTVRRDAPEGLVLAMAFGAIESADRYFVEIWRELTPEEVRAQTALCFSMLRQLVAPEEDSR